MLKEKKTISVMHKLQIFAQTKNGRRKITSPYKWISFWRFLFRIGTIKAMFTVSNIICIVAWIGILYINNCMKISSLLFVNTTKYSRMSVSVENIFILIKRNLLIQCFLIFFLFIFVMKSLLIIIINRALLESFKVNSCVLGVSESYNMK